MKKMSCQGDIINEEEAFKLLDKYKSFLIQDIKNPTENVELKSVELWKNTINYINIENRSKEFYLKMLKILDKEIDYTKHQKEDLKKIIRTKYMVKELNKIM